MLTAGRGVCAVPHPFQIFWVWEGINVSTVLPLATTVSIQLLFQIPFIKLLHLQYRRIKVYATGDSKNGGPQS